MSCVRFVVSGHVQGVFFRASTRERALALGLTGHAVNREDGNVEVLACGEAPALEDLRQWLNHGPPTAQVTNVVAESLPEPKPLPGDFRTG